MTAPDTARRRFLGGLIAAGLMPAPTWADAGSPAYLSAAATSHGDFVLCGIGADLGIRFEVPLPARGHAAAAHPTRPEAVAFARRPGTFAVIIDCTTGAQKAMLRAPAGRHFYGHGVFSSDGDLLFTTENDFDAGRGRIGVWDARHGYARVDEWDSGGIGPHDIKRLPGSDILVVANGGIETHPDTGRTKLNIPTMAPNLAYITAGKLIETATLPADHHKNSIRHLAVDASGQVACGMQWQGDGQVAPLVGTHRRGEPIAVFDLSPEDARAMQGYVGSIAFSADGATLAATSPRGGVLQRYDTASGHLTQMASLPDVSGVAMAQDGFLLSTGTGDMTRIGPQGATETTHAHVAWDNHLINM